MRQCPLHNCVATAGLATRGELEAARRLGDCVECWHEVPIHEIAVNEHDVLSRFLIGPIEESFRGGPKLAVVKYSPDVRHWHNEGGRIERSKEVWWDGGYARQRKTTIHSQRWCEDVHSLLVELERAPCGPAVGEKRQARLRIVNALCLEVPVVIEMRGLVHQRGIVERINVGQHADSERHIKHPRPHGSALRDCYQTKGEQDAGQEARVLCHCVL